MRSAAQGLEEQDLLCVKVISQVSVPEDVEVSDGSSAEAVTVHPVTIVHWHAMERKHFLTLPEK